MSLATQAGEEGARDRARQRTARAKAQRDPADDGPGSEEGASRDEAEDGE